MRYNFPEDDPDGISTEAKRRKCESEKTDVSFAALQTLKRRKFKSPMKSNAV
jgi:hypothetical protein